MKKLIKFGKMTALIWLVFTLFVGYVYLVGQTPRDWDKFIIGIILAPVFETIIYITAPLWLASLLKKKFGGKYWFYICGFIAWYLFTTGHFSLYGRGMAHYAFVVQGFMWVICYWLAKKYNSWVAVIFHAKYNFAILYVLPLIG